MKAIEAVIFDWGNTLVDYPLDTAESQVTWLATFLQDTAKQWSDPLRSELEAMAETEETLYRFNQEMPDYRVRPFEERLREALPSGISAHIASVIERQLCQRLFASAQIIEGAQDVLSRLCQRRLAVGIVSNTPWGTTPNEWRQELDHYDFVRNSCSAVVFCGDVGFRKPHPAAFHACIQRLHVSATQTVVIGDSLSSDMAGACAAGCKSVWFDRKHSGAATPYQPAVVVLANTLGMISGMSAT